MGTIIKRKRKDGTAAWLAQIAVRRAGKTVWRENRTFELRSTAAAWIEKREKDVAKPDALENLPIGETRRREVTLGDAIDKYVEDSAKAIGRTKAQVLKSIKEFDIANKLCAQIDSADIVTFAKEKLNTGASPQTVSNYLSHLSAVFTVAGPAWNYPLDERAMRNAMIVAKKLGLASMIASAGSGRSHQTSLPIFSPGFFMSRTRTRLPSLSRSAHLIRVISS